MAPCIKVVATELQHASRQNYNGADGFSVENSADERRGGGA